jgi:hypothetical protein
MGAVVAAAVVALLVWVVRPMRRRGEPGATGPAVQDAPSRLLAWAVRALPADRAQWGEAMFGELHQMDNQRQRWRFAIGCAGAALLLPSRRADSAGLAARLVAATALAGAGLVAYSLWRYPGILAQGKTWPILTIFLTVLVGYALIATFLVRRGPVARPGLAGGLALAGAWIIGGTATVFQPPQPAHSLALLAIPIASLAVGVAAASRSATAAVRHQVVLLSAAVAGLTFFLVLAGVTLLTAGGPYDAGQLRDFPGSGLPTMATYAVSDNLGSAMMLLLLVPAVTASIGCAAAGITALLAHRATPPR